MSNFRIILFIFDVLPLNIISRYDGGAKKLTHIKPLPQGLMESLAGKLDFLGPYP